MGSTYDISGVSQEYGITYKAESSLVSSYSLPNGVTNNYVYDAFERLTSKTAYRHSVSYTYVSGSALVASETVSRYDGGVTNYSYTYNALGYITAISKDGTTVAEYEYDALGQLVCEEYPVDGVAYVYTYDKAGNITAKNEYPYNANAGQKEYTLYLASQKETVATYGYSTSSWGDMLTNYNGTAITYDAIGNPSNWRNAISMSWFAYCNNNPAVFADYSGCARTYNVMMSAWCPQLK